MNGLSNIKKGMKRTSAVVLAALILASGAESALVSASAAEVETSASTASTLSNEDRGVLFANSRSDFRDESIYFLITTRFYDGDSSNNARTSEDKKAQNPESDPSWRGDFKGLIDKLDYIKALGFTAIWITPVVENDSGYDYHGYHAYDFSAVDTRYESNGVTYQTLIDACHDKGMKVIQDIVLNHTCNWGERNLLQITSDVYSERNQVVMNGKGDPENIYHHNGFCGGPDWDNQGAQKKTIADDCFDLNTENPKVYNYLIDCYTQYINMGVDAFRVDTVKHISRLTFNSVFVPAFKQAGGDKFYMFGEVCTKGHDVWYRQSPPISTCFYTWKDS
ncbi:MAG: glycosidase, partial [Clostridia bacterium]|nr:glycosidase [Clostridia bacterium]